MERKKRSKGSVWEFCYANKIFGTFGAEMRAPGQKLVKFCTLTHTTAKLLVRLIVPPFNQIVTPTRPRKQPTGVVVTVDGPLKNVFPKVGYHLSLLRVKSLWSHIELFFASPSWKTLTSDCVSARSIEQG